MIESFENNNLYSSFKYMSHSAVIIHSILPVYFPLAVFGKIIIINKKIRLANLTVYGINLCYEFLNLHDFVFPYLP